MWAIALGSLFRLHTRFPVRRQVAGGYPRSKAVLKGPEKTLSIRAPQEELAAWRALLGNICPAMGSCKGDLDSGRWNLQRSRLQRCQQRGIPISCPTQSWTMEPLRLHSFQDALLHLRCHREDHTQSSLSFLCCFPVMNLLCASVSHIESGRHKNIHLIG